MNVKNVYIGFIKEQEEVLLYKKDNMFFDLKTKKPVPISQLLENHLFSYSDIIPESSIWKSKIIKNYEKDREQLLELKKCFIEKKWQTIAETY